MEQLLLILYVLVCAAMVGLILLQQGKGADAGASFGSGSSQTMFGPAGGGNVLSRGTGILAAVFFAISIGLAVVAKNKAEDARSGDIPLPAVVESPVSQDLLEIPASAGAEADIPAMEMNAEAVEDIPVMDATVDETAEMPEMPMDAEAAPADVGEELPQ